MSKLLIASEDTRHSGPVTRIGGRPSAPVGTGWPQCGLCLQPMLFLAQVCLADAAVEALAGRDQILLLFQCQHGARLRHQFDQAGRTALLVPSQGTVELNPPERSGTKHASDRTSPPVVDAIGFVWVDLDEAPRPGFRSAYEWASVEDARPIIGKIGGAPHWIEAMERVVCACGKPMCFLAQLEEPASEGFDFGGKGMLYAFVCAGCTDRGHSLLQC
jgi:hypothetical protein